MTTCDHRRRVARLVLARLGNVVGDAEHALRRVVERRRERSRAPSPASPRRTARAATPGSRTRPPAASVALVSTTVSSRSNSSSRSTGARSSGTAASVTSLRRAGRCAPSSAPSARRRRRRPQRAVEPVRHGLQPAAAPPRSSCRSRRAPLGLVRLLPAGRRWSPPIRAARGTRASAASSSAAEPLGPDSDRRRSRRPAAAGRPAPRPAARRAGRTARRWPGAHRPAPGSSRCVQQVEARAAQQVARWRASSCASVGASPRPLRSNRPSSRRTPRLDDLRCRGGRPRRPRGGAPRRAPAAGTAAAPPPPPSCPAPAAPTGRPRAGGGSPPPRRPRAARRRARNRKQRSKCWHLSRGQRSDSALTSSHTSGSGVTGRSLSVPSAVRPAHSAMPISSSSLSGSSSVRCARHRLVHAARGRDSSASP